MEGRICRDSVCTEAASEMRYLQDLSDLLLYLLLPQQEFEAGPVRFVVLSRFGFFRSRGAGAEAALFSPTAEFETGPVRFEFANMADAVEQAFYASFQSLFSFSLKIISQLFQL